MATFDEHRSANAHIRLAIESLVPAESRDRVAALTRPSPTNTAKDMTRELVVILADGILYGNWPH